MKSCVDEVVCYISQEEGLAGFHAADWLDFMKDLNDKFGAMVQKSLTDFFVK